MCRSSTPARAQFNGGSGQIDFLPDKKSEASVLPALCRSFGPMFIFGSILKFLQDILTFASPQILGYVWLSVLKCVRTLFIYRWIITFVKQGGYHWHGPFYAVLMFATATLQTIILAQYFNRMFIVGMRIRTALVATIYRKSLKISNKARKERTAGKLFIFIH